MKKIPLAHNKGVALVDNEDYRTLSKHRWYIGSGPSLYAYTTVRLSNNKNKVIRMHTMIIGKAPSGFETDHINRNKLDNRKKNLRFATRSQNAQNAKLKSASGYTGVRWTEGRKKPWQVTIKFNGKSVYCGSYKNKKEAAMAYDAKALELFGPYASLNFPKKSRR